jgi:MoaA/NifB/PqqE/SkfB family radical SAM enzyme
MLSQGRSGGMFNMDNILKKTNLKLKQQAEVMSGPLQLGIDITNRCVLKCKHCFNRSSNLLRDEMDDEIIRDIFNQIKDIKPQQMCICGGEPLLREKIVIESIKKLTDVGIVMGVVTNGNLINKENAEELSASKIGQVQVSVDGFMESHDRLRGVKGAFKKAIKGIEHLRNADVSVITSFSPTRFNIGEFPKYIEFVRSIGVEEVRIQPLMPLGDGQLHSEIFPSDEQYCKLSQFIRKYNYENCRDDSQYTENINEIRVESSKGFNIMWGDPVDHIIRFSKFITKPTYTYQIYSTGKIGLTPYFPITFGDVKKHCLNDYWEAGLKNIWEYDIVQRLAKQVRSVADMSKIDPPTYFCKDIEIDLIENTSEEIEQITDYYFGKKAAA